MRKAGARIQEDIFRIHSDSFVELCRGCNSSAFTRNRKMPSDDLLFSMINRRGLTLHMELREYMKISHPGTQISKPGYLKQRMKLNPEAFVDLFHHHNKNFYSDPDTKPYNYRGYLMLAADGSSINIPTTPETLEAYGTCSNHKSRPIATLGLQGLYDVLNRMIIEADCCRSKYNEAQVAEEQFSRLENTIGELPYITIMDRAYPSMPFIIRLIRKKTYFVMRLKASDFKSEQNSMKNNDGDIEIILSKERKRHYEGTKDWELMCSVDSFNLRFVKVWLDDKNFEVLATNLPRDQFEEDCFKEIYHMRWGIETAFLELKNRLQMENFTGTKPILLEQDIYSTIYVCNIAEDIARDAEKEQKDHYENDYKHRMAINRSVCIGILKNDLIYILLEPDPSVQDELFENIYREISNNIVPIRPDRHYERQKGNFAGKYSNTNKRGF